MRAGKESVRRAPRVTGVMQALLLVIAGSHASAVLAQDYPGGFSDAREAAVINDPALRQSTMVYRTEQEEDDLSRSRLLPDVRFTASYQYEDSDNIYTDQESTYYDPSLDRSSGELTDKYWRLSLNQPLFNYTAYHDYKRDKAYTQGSEYRYQRAEQELTFRVAEQYQKVLLASQQVYLNSQKLNALELKLTQAERAYGLGVGDKLLVLQVQSRRDLARSDVLQAESELNDAKTLLTNITGEPAQVPLAWIENGHQVQPNLLSGSEQTWLDKLDNNFQVQESVSAIDQSQYNVKAKRGGHLPTVNFSLSYADRDSEDDIRSRKDLVAAIQVSVPLYAGGYHSASTRKALAQLEEARARRDLIVSEKQQQIKLAYTRLESFKERLAALIESMESGQNYLDAAEREHALNLGDRIAVLDARTQLVDTQLQYVQTLNNYLVADLMLHLETGLLVPQRLQVYDSLFNDAAQKAAVN